MARRNKNPEETENPSDEAAMNEERENPDETGQGEGTENSDQDSGAGTDTTENGEGDQDKPDPKAEDPPPAEGEVTVISEKRNGKTITAVTGKPIVFDGEGRAKASRADADYLKNLPGFEIK